VDSAGRDEFERNKSELGGVGWVIMRILDLVIPNIAMELYMLEIVCRMHDCMGEGVRGLCRYYKKVLRSVCVTNVTKIDLYN